MTARTAKEALLDQLFSDFDDLLDRLEKVKAEIPASVEKSVADGIGLANDHYSQLAHVLSSLRPEIQKVIAAETDNMAAQVGTLVAAADVLNKRANEVIEKKTTSIETIVKNQVEAAIAQSLSSKISNEISELNRKLDQAGKRVEKIAAAAEMSSRGSVKKWLLSMFGAALAGGVIALAGGWFIASSPQTPFAIRVDTRSVAEILLEIEQQKRQPVGQR